MSEITTHSKRKSWQTAAPAQVRMNDCISQTRGGVHATAERANGQNQGDEAGGPQRAHAAALCRPTAHMDAAEGEGAQNDAHDKQQPQDNGLSDAQAVHRLLLVSGTHPRHSLPDTSQTVQWVPAGASQTAPSPASTLPVHATKTMALLGSLKTATRNLFASTGVPLWEPALLAQKLAQQDFATLVALLNEHVDVAREPRAIDWCTENGYRQGHVPVLYVLVRNGLKHQSGRVPTTEQTLSTFLHALVLLLRVAQDVRCCHLDLAKSDRGFVYVVFRDKIRMWMSSWNPHTLPSVPTLVPYLERWCHERMTSLPLPTWAAAFSSSVVGDTFYWNTPSTDDTTSFQRCKTLVTTRLSVTQAFLAFLKRQETLLSALSADLADVLS